MSQDIKNYKDTESQLKMKIDTKLQKLLCSLDLW